MANLLGSLSSGQFNSLLDGQRYFNQITSLSLSPANAFTVTNWTSLVSQITDVLYNPYFLGLLLVLVVLSLISFSD